jgi:DNA gyrase/topoisomerase IV subunit B
MSREYTADSITGFTRDLEKIQAKPTLYIGPTDNAGVFTLLRECLDNAVDEARAGRNDFIYVVVESLQGPFIVGDKGVGIPVAKHKKMKISTLTHVLTNLQSSGKMKVGGAYKSAVGTHGVGIKATNALSSQFEVWTYRDNKKEGEKGWYYTKFERGVEKVPVKKSSGPGKVMKADAGTVIKFTPDPKVFGKHKLEMKQLVQWAKMTAYMNAGLQIRIAYNGSTKDFKSKDGIKAYLKDRIEALKATPFSKKHIFHNSETLELALSFTDVEGSQVEFFTNTVRNVEEGVHADDVYKALFDSLKPYVKVKKGKDSKFPFTPTDLRDGLLGIVNYKIDAPQFDSQTKEKLVDQRVKGACYEEAHKVFVQFWKDNKSLAKDLIVRATELRNKTSDFLKDKKLVKNVKAATKGISAKLAGIVGNAPVEKRELFLVEGDSAGGGLKRARDKSFQAVFPLKGKPLNVMEAQKDKVNSNKEIVGILAALGVQLDGKNAGAIKYGKIICFADPDVDGMHINTLLLSTLYKYTPNLFKNGNVYVIKSPLFKAKYKDKVYFGMTKEELYEQTGSKKIDITYLKGWGEVSEVDLIPVALDPSSRKLYRVVPSDKAGSKEFELLMGKNPTYRKQLLGVR